MLTYILHVLMSHYQFNSILRRHFLRNISHGDLNSVEHSARIEPLVVSCEKMCYIDRVLPAPLFGTVLHFVGGLGTGDRGTVLMEFVMVCWYAKGRPPETNLVNNHSG